MKILLWPRVGKSFLIGLGCSADYFVPYYLFLSPPTIVLDLNYGIKHSPPFMTHNHWSMKGPALVLSIHFSFIVYPICSNEFNDYLLLVLLNALFSACIFSLHKWYYTSFSYFFSLRTIIVNVHLHSCVYIESVAPNLCVVF